MSVESTWLTEYDVLDPWHGGGLPFCDGVRLQCGLLTVDGDKQSTKSGNYVCRSVKCPFKCTSRESWGRRVDVARMLTSPMPTLTGNGGKRELFHEPKASPDDESGMTLPHGASVVTKADDSSVGKLHPPCRCTHGRNRFFF